MGTDRVRSGSRLNHLGRFRCRTAGLRDRHLRRLLGLGRSCRFCCLLGLDWRCRFCCRRAVCISGFQRQDQSALRHLVANLGFDFLDRAAERAGNIHRSLVGFERDQRVILVDGVAGLYQHFNDIDAVEIPDVRDEYFLDCHV